MTDVTRTETAPAHSILLDLREICEELADAELAAARARTRRNDLIRQALDDGHTGDEVARAAGMARVSMYRTIRD